MRPIAATMPENMKGLNRKGKGGIVGEKPRPRSERPVQHRRERLRLHEAHHAHAFALLAPAVEEDDPRRAEQAEALEQLGIEIDKVVNLLVEDSTIEARMAGRRVCAKCGASYHIKNKPSKVEGVCDRCGGELVIRKDDRPETVRDRLVTYHQQTEPLVDFYRKRGKLVDIPDQGSIEATNAYILKQLEA